MFGVAVVTERFGDRQNNQTCSFIAVHVRLFYLYCLPCSSLTLLFVVALLWRVRGGMRIMYFAMFSMLRGQSATADSASMFVCL